MAEVELRQIEKSFSGTRVIPTLDLAIRTGEFVVFVGPSGCGKSTLLRLIAGLEIPDSGTIAIAGKDVTRAEPVDRGVAMVFQTYALYPHMTVRQNITFGLEMAGVPKARRDEEVSRAADVLQIGELLERKPRELSGGQRQRVAIGRAIVRDPAVFLFDEPLSNLDAELRVQMRLEILRLHARLDATMIYVTHDQTEAMTMADRIVVLRKGRIEQVGRPDELYSDPDNLFVAGFIGSPRMNFLAATVTGRAASGAVLVDVPELGLDGVHVPLRNQDGALPQTVTLGLRPEDLANSAGHTARKTSFRITAQIVENLGSVIYVHSKLGQGTAFVSQIARGNVPRTGDTLELSLDGARCFLFGPDGSRL